MHWSTLAEELGDPLRRGNLDYCIQRVSDVIHGLPDSPFHRVLNLDFTNDPVEVANHLDQFVKEQENKIQLAALYTETNGFYINPNRWYFEIFAYSKYGGHSNYDWLALWDVLYPHSITLTGMESLQQVYETAWKDELDEVESKQLRVANDLCDLLVVLRFQNLIQRSAAFMQNVTVPVLATAHDYDFIYEVRPALKNP